MSTRRTQKHIQAYAKLKLGLKACYGSTYVLICKILQAQVARRSKLRFLSHLYTVEEVQNLRCSKEQFAKKGVETASQL